jgi:glycosyltransferase involved in cell wall biosynthesis
MKYPSVLFFSLDKYANILSFFSENTNRLDCNVIFIKDSKELNKLFNPSCQILVTYGPEEKEYHTLVLPFIPPRICNRWFHLKEITSIDAFNHAVNYCFIHNCSLTREFVRPCFSAFTTCYNSYEKILRAYKSILGQTNVDWEWVILDDSPDDSHFKFLKENLQDERVRLYKRSENSGNIGNVKNEAVSLCRGKYVLEMDHDDEILPDVFKDASDFFEKNKDVGFVYMDFINIRENGDNFLYGDFVGKGYGGYYCQKYNNKWVYVYISSNINNITMSHLVCCPNHPRIWRKDVLMEAGNYSEFLPVCDDYEILLRTSTITKMARICKLGYVQYMNENNNNFSLIRNAEINRIGPHFIMPIFYDSLKIHDKMKEKNAYEDEKYIHNISQVWLRNTSEYKYLRANLIYHPDYDKQYCIIGLDCLLQNLDLIKNLYTNTRNDFIVLDTCPTNYIWEALDKHELTRMKCYSFKDYTQDQLINYFEVMYKFNENYEIIQNKNPDSSSQNPTNFNEIFKLTLSQLV